MSDTPEWEPACEDTKNGTGWQEATAQSFHSAETTYSWIVVLGYPGRPITLHGPFDEFSDAERFAKWITDKGGVPATVLSATSVTTGAVMLAKFHAEKEKP